MNNDTKFYVHCGMHKTGTTALQGALRASEAPLREAGFLIPRAGRMDGPKGRYVEASYDGHHNIAWELTRDRRFHPMRGSIAALATEIETFHGNVIISSEDFETCLARPEKFLPLQQIARDTGREFVLIVYLRSQLSYWESLFPEILKAGAGDEHDRLAARVLETGHLAFEEWDHQFDYERVLRACQDVPGVSLIIRNYHAIDHGSILNDFARLVGAEGVLSAPAGQEYSNRRETPAQSLRRFYENRSGRELSLAEAARIKHLCRELPELASDPALHKAFADRFREPNMRLCRSLNIPEAGLTMPPVPPPMPRISYGQFFSFETQCAIRSGTVEDGTIETGEIMTWWNSVRAVGDDRPVQARALPLPVRKMLYPVYRSSRFVQSWLTKVIQPD